MKTENNPELNYIARKVLRYLESNPNAADTKYGIAQWWLQQQILSDHLSETEHALNKLVKLNLIEKLPVVGGEYIYRSLSKPGQDDG